LRRARSVGNRGDVLSLLNQQRRTDSAVVGDERSVPVAIAARVKVPTLVMDGGASLGPMPFMRATADKLGKVVPSAQRQVIEGQADDVSAKSWRPILLKFFD
jgi:hypothetical protein